MKVIMPQIGMTMIAGIIDNWKVKDGDYVQKGDVIVEITTEKLSNDIEAPAAGKIHLLAEEGESVDCGEPIAEIEE